MCYCGQTFHVPNGIKHLHFVITDPVAIPPSEDKKILLVGITRDITKGELILKRGDHPFIQDVSYVNYGKALLYPSRDVERFLKCKIWERDVKAKRKVIEKISNGILKSEHTTPRIKKFYNYYKKLNNS